MWGIYFTHTVLFCVGSFSYTTSATLSRKFRAMLLHIPTSDIQDMSVLQTVPNMLTY